MCRDQGVHRSQGVTGFSEAFTEAFELLALFQPAVVNFCTQEDHDLYTRNIAGFYRYTVWPDGRPRIQEALEGDPSLLLGNCPDCNSTLSYPLRAGAKEVA